MGKQLINLFSTLSTVDIDWQVSPDEALHTISVSYDIEVRNTHAVASDGSMPLININGGGSHLFSTSHIDGEIDIRSEDFEPALFIESSLSTGKVRLDRGLLSIAEHIFTEITL